MKVKNLILLGLLFSTKVLHAQTDFRPGYVITMASDTLIGEIDYRGDLLMSSVCKFRDKNNTVKKYYPNDILAFRFIDSKYYVSKDIGSKKVFLEYLIKGQVNVYYLRDDSGDQYYIDKEGMGLTEIPYEEGTKYIDDKKVFFETTRHIGLLTYYMQDAPRFKSRIQSLKKPEHETLIKLAEDYHNATCEGEQCIIYEKSTPLIKVFPELLLGTINHTNVEGLNDRFYAHGGIVGHLWLPRTSEKMYFRTGLLFSQLDFDDGLRNIYKIPFQFEYIYPKGIIRPRIAYGLNFYLPSYQTVSFDIGANIKVSDTFFISATTDIEYSPVMFVLPNSLFAYSIKLGLFINID